MIVLLLAGAGLVLGGGDGLKMGRTCLRLKGGMDGEAVWRGRGREDMTGSGSWGGEAQQGGVPPAGSRKRYAPAGGPDGGGEAAAGWRGGGGGGWEGYPGPGGGGGGGYGGGPGPGGGGSGGGGGGGGDQQRRGGYGGGYGGGHGGRRDDGWGQSGGGYGREPYGGGGPPPHQQRQSSGPQSGGGYGSGGYGGDAYAASPPPSKRPHMQPPPPQGDGWGRSGGGGWSQQQSYRGDQYQQPQQQLPGWGGPPSSQQQYQQQQPPPYYPQGGQWQGEHGSRWGSDRQSEGYGAPPGNGGGGGGGGGNHEGYYHGNTYSGDSYGGRGGRGGWRGGRGGRGGRQGGGGGGGGERRENGYISTETIKHHLNSAHTKKMIVRTILDHKRRGNGQLTMYNAALVSMALNRMAKVSATDRQTDDKRSFYLALNSLFARVHQVAGELTSRGLSSVAHAAAIFSRNDTELVSVLSKRAVEPEMLANFTSQGMSNIVWSYGKLKIKDEENVANILHICDYALDQPASSNISLANFNVMDVTNCLSGLGSMGCRGARMVPLLFERITSTGMIDSLSEVLVSQLLWSCVQLHVEDPEIVNSLIERLEATYCSSTPTPTSTSTSSADGDGAADRNDNATHAAGGRGNNVGGGGGERHHGTLSIDRKALTQVAFSLAEIDKRFGGAVDQGRIKHIMDKIKASLPGLCCILQKEKIVFYSVQSDDRLFGSDEIAWLLLYHTRMDARIYITCFMCK